MFGYNTGKGAHPVPTRIAFVSLLSAVPWDSSLPRWLTVISFFRTLLPHGFYLLVHSLSHCICFLSEGLVSLPVSHIQASWRGGPVGSACHCSRKYAFHVYCARFRCPPIWWTVQTRYQARQEMQAYIVILYLLVSWSLNVHWHVDVQVPGVLLKL